MLFCGGVIAYPQLLLYILKNIMQVLFNTFLKINVAYFLGSAKNCEPYPPPYNYYKTRLYKEPVLNVHEDMGTWGHGDMGTWGR